MRLPLIVFIALLSWTPSDTQQCIGSLKVIEESFTQCEDYAIWSLWRSLMLSGYLAQFQLASVFMFYS